jgi:hypothetical protein
MYKIEPIATFQDHQCVNVVERILKDPTHPITQKETVKSHHSNLSQQLLKQKHTRTAPYKKHYELKEIDMSTNPRKAETTTPEYITVIQDLKLSLK